MTAIVLGSSVSAQASSVPMTRPPNCASPLCALPQEVGDHRPTVFLEALVADAMCPDDGAEALPQRLDREQFGILTLNCPAAAMLWRILLPIRTSRFLERALATGVGMLLRG